jgi:hypothetical protein
VVGLGGVASAPLADVAVTLEDELTHAAPGAGAALPRARARIGLVGGATPLTATGGPERAAAGQAGQLGHERLRYSTR